MFTPRRIENRLLLLGMAALLPLSLSACGKDPVPVPDVAGVKLSDARVVLEDAGFDEVETKDLQGERSPFLDGNWVVVEQDPPSKSAVSPGSPVTLSILKVDDDGVIELLPENSPVAKVISEKESEAKRKNEESERESKRQEEKRKQEESRLIQEYVDSIDAAARLVQAGTPDLITVAEMLRQSGRPAVQTTYKARDVKNALGTFSDLIEVAPSSINSNVDFVQESLVKFQRAADLLNVVSPATAEDTLNRFDELYAEAREAYNVGLTDVYEQSTIDAPTIS